MLDLEFDRVDYIPGRNSKNSSVLLVDILNNFIACRYKMAVIKYDGKTIYSNANSIRMSLARIKKLYPDRFDNIEVIKRGETCYLLNKDI